MSAAALAHYRKHAIMAALIISAVVTPDATLFTMLLMAVPLMVLYEIGIIGAKIFGRATGPAPDMNLPSTRIYPLVPPVIASADPVFTILKGGLIMLRRIIVLTALSGRQSVWGCAGCPFSGGNESSGSSKLEQAHPGQEPAGSSDIGNTSIQALASGSGGVIYAGSFGMGIFAVAIGEHPGRP